MGVALTSCTVPAAGKPTFQIGDDEMEMGVGIHGEPGRRRVKLGSADAIAGELVGVDPEGPVADARPGGDPARQRLRRHAADGAVPDGQRRAQGAGEAPAIKVARHLTGSYVTSLEMAGCSITVTAVDAGVARAVGRAGAHRGAALGRLSTSRPRIGDPSPGPRIRT